MGSSKFVKLLFVISVCVSIFVIYYNLVIDNKYKVYTNEDGPDTSDYFLIEESEE